MKFTKMQGLGNDYVYVNCFEEKIDNPPELARRISDRHFGVGSDGLIMINPSDRADFEMEMYNADGSRGEMCGNGIRCVAKYVYDYGLTDKTDISVETLGGIKYLELTVEDGKVRTVKVDMGKPELEPQKIPVKADGDKAVDEPILVGGEEYRMTCVSMGNPHAVVFVGCDVRDFPLEEIGPKFESHERFPNRVNTEFVRVIDRHTAEMRVWERGSGETLACVSYPGYDNNRLANNMDTEYYAHLYEDMSRPFYNKATQQLTAPGSTFKPLTAIAGLEEGIVNSNYVVNCTGRFDLISNGPYCWLRTGHGPLDVVGGITNSCNVFFSQVAYDLGKDSDGNFNDSLGVEQLAKYANLFRLNEKISQAISSHTVDYVVMCTSSQIFVDRINDDSPIELKSAGFTTLSDNLVVSLLDISSEEMSSREIYSGNLVQTGLELNPSLYAREYSSARKTTP